MRTESLLFAGSFLASVYFCGLPGAAGLVIFGFLWLMFGSDK